MPRSTLTVVVALLACALPASRAVGQLMYISQSRAIAAGSTSKSAPDFGPFNESVSSGTIFNQASASQNSTLGASSIVASGTASPVLGQTAASSSCVVQFIALGELNFSYSLNGDNVTIIGPGVSIGGDNVNQSGSGVFQPLGLYTVSASTAGSLFGCKCYSVNLNITGAVRAPQGSSFTYQGRLANAGTGLNGPADFQFRLFPSSDSNTQIGPTVTSNALAVTGGVFAAELDFGNVFDGMEKWLEISVRAPAGAGEFTTLSPRTRLASAPYASWANEATWANYAATASTIPWSGITGVPNNVSKAFSPWSSVTLGGIYYPSGAPLGIGTSTPQTTLHVKGNGGLMDVEGSDHCYLQFYPFGFGAGRKAYVGVPGAGSLNFDVANQNAGGVLNLIGSFVTVVGTFTNNSDAREKHDVREIDDPLAVVQQLHGVRYRWNERGLLGEPLPEGEQVGFLAQDVEKVLPELVHNDSAGRKSVAYTSIIPVLTEALKSLEHKLEDRNRDVAALRAENEQLKERMDRLERLLGQPR